MLHSNLSHVVHHHWLLSLQPHQPLPSDHLPMLSLRPTIHSMPFIHSACPNSAIFKRQSLPSVSSMSHSHLIHLGLLIQISYDEDQAVAWLCDIWPPQDILSFLLTSPAHMLQDPPPALHTYHPLGGAPICYVARSCDSGMTARVPRRPYHELWRSHQCAARPSDSSITGLSVHCKWPLLPVAGPPVYWNSILLPSGGPAHMAQAPPTAQPRARLYISSAPLPPMAGPPICCKILRHLHNGPTSTLQVHPFNLSWARPGVAYPSDSSITGPFLYWNCILPPFCGPAHMLQDAPIAS